MTAAATRRAILGGMALLPLAACPMTPVPAAPAADRSAWDHAFATMVAAHVVSEQASADFWKVHEAWDATEPPLSMIDTYAIMPLGRHEPRLRSFAHSDDLDEWDRNIANPEWGGGEPSKVRERKSIASVREFRRLRDENDQRHGYSAASDRTDEADDALCEAERRLILMPAPDGDALMWKLEHLYGGCAKNPAGDSPNWSNSYVNAVVADARRLLRNPVPA